MSSISTLRWSVAALGVVSLFGLTACGKKKEQPFQVQTETVARRSIRVTTDATGTVEPVDTVAVKSQASGLIYKMPIEVGATVKPGDLIAQIDTRNLKNDYDRTVAQQQAAESTLVVNQAAMNRADALFKQGVITATEHESAVVALANARSALVAATTNLSVAKQNLDYATVRAEVSGTVISKSASVGSVVSSAVSTFGGGSTIVTIADLSRVRMRVLVNETDIANVHVGQHATVSIDAMPNKQLQGVVEKVEPQAVVQQSVTMFPVLVSLPNADRALLPGMNGEVTLITQEADNVVAIPTDALTTRQNLATIADVLGASLDSLGAMARGGRSDSGAQGNAQGGAQNGAQGAQGGQPASGAGSQGQRGAAAGGGGANGARTGTGARSGRGNVQFVFVKRGTTYIPRAVRTGVTNFDYAEVTSGVQEGEEVALLSAVIIQAERNRTTNRIRSMTGGGLPGTGGSTSGTRPAGGSGGGGGGTR